MTDWEVMLILTCDDPGHKPRRYFGGENEFRGETCDGAREMAERAGWRVSDEGKVRCPACVTRVAIRDLPGDGGLTTPRSASGRRKHRTFLP